MDQNDFRTLQFTSLRREIEALQTRGFWVVFVGLLGTPPLSHFLLNASTPVWLTLPFFLVGAHRAFPGAATSHDEGRPLHP